MTRRAEIVVIGGGVIGLSSAWALCQSGRSVDLYDAPRPGTQASWAGGGILSPLPPWDCADALKPLLEESLQSYPAWCENLQSLTGIDPEYWRCGLHMPRQDLWLPQIAQVRSPRLLTALRRALTLRGARIHNLGVERILCEGDRVSGVQVQGRAVAVERVVLAAGAWSGSLHAPTRVTPIKGEMLLLRGRPGLLDRIVLDGETYLVPRRDGRVLVGSTLEDVGFNAVPSCTARNHLLKSALDLCPGLSALSIEQHWAGLRARPQDGLPLIGATETRGLYRNTGHYRLGITLAPASARRLARAVT